MPSCPVHRCHTVTLQLHCPPASTHSLLPLLNVSLATPPSPLHCPAGLSRGQIQKLQQDAGKWMGMASLLCESAGWWPLATLYANLSQVSTLGDLLVCGCVIGWVGRFVAQCAAAAPPGKLHGL